MSAARELRAALGDLLGRYIAHGEDVSVVAAEIRDLAATRPLVPAARLLDLADWHETKADKAIHHPGPLQRNEDVMRGKAEVHRDAARRLRELAASFEPEVVE